MFNRYWKSSICFSFIAQLMMGPMSYALLPHEDANLQAVRNAFENAKEALNLSVPGKYFCEHYHASRFEEPYAGQSTLEFKRRLFTGNWIASNEFVEFTFVDHQAQKGVPHISSICRLGEDCKYQLNLRRGTFNGKSVLIVETTLDQSQVAGAHRSDFAVSISDPEHQLALSYGICTSDPQVADQLWPSSLVGLIHRVKKSTISLSEDARSSQKRQVEEDLEPRKATRPDEVASSSPLSSSSSLTSSSSVSKLIADRRSLLEAIKTGNLEKVQEVHRSNPSLMKTVHNGGTVLHLAAAHGQLAIVSYLSETFPELLKEKSKQGWTVLHAAIGPAFSLTVFQELMNRSPELLTELTPEGYNVLHQAAANPSIPKILKSLLGYIVYRYPGQLKVLLSQMTNEGKTPAQVAREKGIPGKLVRRMHSLISVLESSPEAGSLSEFFNAIRDGKLQRVQEIYKRNPDYINSKTSKIQASVLHLAATYYLMNNCIEMGVFQFLWSKLENPIEMAESINSRGETILHTMVKYNNLKLIQFLKANQPELFDRLLFKLNRYKKKASQLVNRNHQRIKDFLEAEENRVLGASAADSVLFPMSSSSSSSSHSSPSSAMDVEESDTDADSETDSE